MITENKLTLLYQVIFQFFSLGYIITRSCTKQYNVSIKYNINDRYETFMIKVSALDTISGYKKQRYRQK